MKMLIGGRQTEASDGRTLDVINPANNEFVDTIPMASDADIEEALSASVQGCAEWSRVPLREKEAVFGRFCGLLEENKREILSTLIRESGCSIRNALMQFQGLPALFKGYLETAKRMDGRVLVPGTESGHDGHTERDLQLVTHEPVGTVVAIVPFNAPLMLFGYKVAPALAAGNAVIAKPPTTNPLAMTMVAKLLWDAGVPRNALQVVSGSGSVVGNRLVADPRVAAVTLTGSTGVGLNIAGILAKRLAPCALELGGNDPFLVLEDADLSRAVREAAFWRFNSAGQVCISPKRFLVHNRVKDRFTQGVLDFARTITMGTAVDVDRELDRYLGADFSSFHGSGMVMNCLISEKAAKTVEAQVAKTVEQGARVLTGGHRHGAFYEPTILTEVTKDMDIMKDMEIFGPVLPICGFDGDDEALAIANASSYGLSGCVFTRDWRKGMNLARRIESGGVVVNGTGTYRNMMQPFGGYKLSGAGREGFLTLGEMVREKVIILKDFYD